LVSRVGNQQREELNLERATQLRDNVEDARQVHREVSAMHQMQPPRNPNVLQEQAAPIHLQSLWN